MMIFMIIFVLLFRTPQGLSWRSRAMLGVLYSCKLVSDTRIGTAVISGQTQAPTRVSLVAQVPGSCAVLGLSVDHIYADSAPDYVL